MGSPSLPWLPEGGCGTPISVGPVIPQVRLGKGTASGALFMLAHDRSRPAHWLRQVAAKVALRDRGSMIAMERIAPWGPPGALETKRGAWGARRSVAERPDRDQIEKRLDAKTALSPPSVTDQPSR